MQGTGANIVQRFRAAEGAGVGASVAVAEAYTRLDGPRTDVGDTTLVWVDRWGAPTRIRDALGNETSLQRGDAAFPARVTRLRGPGGLVTRGSYTARGNPRTVTVENPLGDGRDAVTRYEYGDARFPDFVTRIVPPERDSLVIGYDAAGNRAWIQDARGDSTRVEVFSNALGQVTSTRTPAQRRTGAQRDSIEYDAAGNLRRARTPLGFWTEYFKDHLGRDTLVTTPTDSAQTPALRQRARTVYDVMGRVLRTEARGPALNGAPAEGAVATYEYDREGRVRAVSRFSDPDAAEVDTITTRFEHDRAGRPGLPRRRS